MKHFKAISFMVSAWIFKYFSQKKKKVSSHYNHPRFVRKKFSLNVWNTLTQLNFDVGENWKPKTDEAPPYNGLGTVGGGKKW